MQFNANQVGSGNISNTEFDTLNGVESNIQDQFDALVTALGGKQAAAAALTNLVALAATITPGQAVVAGASAGDWEAADMPGGPSVGDYKLSWQQDAHDGWLPCDGAILSQATYPDLSDVLLPISEELAQPYLSPSGRGQLTNLASAWGNPSWQYCGKLGSLWFAFMTSEQNDYYTSTDGVTWTPRSLPTTMYVTGIAYDGTTYVLASSVGIHTSTSGTGSWTSRTSTLTAGTIKSLTYGNGKFVAGGTNASNYAAVAESADGANWTARQVYTIANSVTNIAWLPDASLWVAHIISHNHVYTSPNLTTWTDRKTAAQTYSYNQPLINSQQILILGEGNTYIMRSAVASGTTWTEANNAIASGYYPTGGCVIDDVFFVAAYNASSNVQGIYRSPNGITWTKVLSLPNTTTYKVRGLAADGVDMVMVDDAAGGYYYVSHVAAAWDPDTEFTLPTIAVDSSDRRTFVYSGVTP